MRTKFLGINRNRALFEINNQGLVINTVTHSVREVDLHKTLTASLWVAPAPTDDSWVAWSEIAGYSTLQPVTAAAPSSRTYAVPRAVVDEARLGLARAERIGREHQTLSSLETGELLTAGKPLPYAKLQHVAKFFDSHPVTRLERRNAYDKTCFSLWGGDAGKKWVANMTARGTLSLTSDGFLINSEDMSVFERDDVILLALSRKGDPFAIEALMYLEDVPDEDEPVVFMWDAGRWVPYTDTEALDDMAEQIVEVDPETAVNIAAQLDESPGELVYLATLNPDETALAIMALFESELVSNELVAAAEYSPEERSANAGKQPRDSGGRFATVGAQGVMKSGQRGTIRGINPANQYLLIEAETGGVYSIPSRDFTIQDAVIPDRGDNVPDPAASPSGEPPKIEPLDLSGILAQPRALTRSSKAVLSRSLPPLNPAALRKIVEDYNEYIREEREANARKFTIRAAAPVLDSTAMTPDTSDVKPIYMAEVDRDDTQAVMDLIALSPASSTSNEATTFRRVAGQWVRDDSVLRDLKSATPPPVVVLNDADLQSVLTQVDQSAPEDESVAASAFQLFLGASGEVYSFVAAGDGVPGNGVGAAERLRIYWTAGKGGLKIRWGTPGDWTRCHRYLRKYLGERSRGYCSLRHHEMTGMWPGDKKNQ